MSVIENFAALSEKEQREFAEALVKTINSEHTFIDNTTFDIVDVEADDLTGGLNIEVSHEPLIEVRRKATWQAADEEDATSEDAAYVADYAEYGFKDAEKAFKTLSADIDGYTVYVEIDDVDEEEIVEIEVEHMSHEDDGIGQHEYWGNIGYDSRPYVEVEGTIVQACTCSMTLFVEPADAIKVEPEEN